MPLDLPAFNGGLGEADFQAGDIDLPPYAPALHISALNATQCGYGGTGVGRHLL